MIVRRSNAVSSSSKLHDRFTIKDLSSRWKGRFSGKYVTIHSRSNDINLPTLTSCLHSFQYRQLHGTPINFVVNVNFGYGQKKSLQERNILEKSVSAAQRKQGNLELEKMKKSTTEILSTHHVTIQNSDVLANKVRVAIHYWLSRWHLHYHPISPVKIGDITLQTLQYSPEKGGDESLYGDYGMRQASHLLRWIMQMNDSHSELKLVDKILSIDDNAAFVNLIEVCLIPCNSHLFAYGSTLSSPMISSTHDDTHDDKDDATYPTNFVDAMKEATKVTSSGLLISSTKKQVDPTRWIPALRQACYILDIMNTLHQDPGNGLKSDILGTNMTLKVWSYLSLLLGHYENMKPFATASKESIDWDTGEVFDTIPTKNPLPSSCEMTSALEILEKMDELLRKTEKHFFETRDENAKPDEYTYNTVVDAWVQSQLPVSLSRIESYIERMERTEDEDSISLSDGTLRPDKFNRTTVYAGSITYNAYLNAHVLAASKKMNSRLPYNKELAGRPSKILQRMEERYAKYQRKEAQPDTFTYATVLNSYATLGDASTAEFILNKIIDLSGDPDHKERVQPNLICFNSCLNAWARSKHPRAAESAERLLMQMEELSLSSEYSDVQPDTISYSSVISTWARSGSKNCGDRAEALLDRSFQLYEAGRESLKADTITFNSVLKALAKQCQILDSESPKDMKATQEKAERLLQKMHQLRDSGDVNISPGTISYNILLDLYARTKSPRKAEQLLESMNRQYGSGNHELRPDCISYNSLLFAFSNEGSKESIDKAESLLKAMEEGTNEVQISPDNYSYSTLANFYAKSRDASMAQRAEDMLRRMERRHSDGQSQVKPDTQMYNVCIDAWNKCGEPGRAEKLFHMMVSKSKADDTICPDVVSFTSVLNAIANSKDKENIPLKAEAIISQMEIQGVKPNRYCYNSLINCYAKSEAFDAPSKAEDILLEMVNLGDELSPDVVTFSTVIKCWSNSKEENAAEHAQKVLDLLEELSSTGKVRKKPNSYAYSSVLKSWARVGEGEKALDLLNVMDQRYKSGEKHMKPSEYCYNIVINAIAKDRNRETKAADAKALLDRMITTPGINPTFTTYSTVLNACAHTYVTTRQDKEIAFDIARKCFRELLSGKYGRTNNTVFRTFMRVCSNLLPKSEKRDRLLVSVFQECIKAGLVDIKMIINMRRSLSSEAVQELFKDTTLAYGHVDENSSIPRKWCENVDKKR